MSESMKFSVTIPAYKSRFLDEAVRSVLCQTYTDWELIVVDDCSPENLQAIVEPFLQDKRIRYYRNERNCGAVNVVDNWNICLGYCTGDYVICMGDDDRLLPTCLEEYRKCIEKYPDVDVFYGETAIINEHSVQIRTSPKHPEWESTVDFMYHLWCGRDQFIGNVLIKASRLREMGGYAKFPIAWGSDHITVIWASEPHGVVSTEDIVFLYRQHSDTLSMSKNQLEPKLLADKEVFNWYSHFLSEQIKKGEEPAETVKKLIKMLPNHRRNRIVWDLAEAYPTKPFEIIKAYLKMGKEHRDTYTLLRALCCSVMK